MRFQKAKWLRNAGKIPGRMPRKLTKMDDVQAPPIGTLEQLTVSMISEVSMLNGIPEAGLLLLTVQINVRKSEKSYSTFLAGAVYMHRLSGKKFTVLSKIRHTGDRKEKKKGCKKEC